MKLFACIAASLVVWVCWAGSPVSMAGDGNDVTKVNSSVRASAGQTYDSVTTVNGDVTVERGATVNSATTVNGSIRIEDDARIGNATTVNGSLHISEGVSVEKEARTVNGDIEMRARSRVGGDVGTVNGDIELSNAEVGGQLTTRRGDIELTDGSRVRGGILVKKNRGWSDDHKRPIEVRICATCVVDGELRFERPVNLRVENGARIGTVIGDEVTRL